MNREEALAFVCARFCGQSNAGRGLHDDACSALRSPYEEMLRAARAELALLDRERKLARVLEMVDAWERDLPEKINTAVAAGAIRRAARGMEFAP